MNTFHFTVQGERHLQKGICCQDASASFESDGMQIVSVADGHSASECFRSEIGARLAVETALETLKEFGSELSVSEELQQAIIDSGKQNRLLHYTAALMVRRWKNAVIEHLRQKPFSEAEIRDHPEAIKNPVPAYGSTLLAALQIRDQIFCFQQGDGRLFVLYTDGAFEQPVPWDPFCHENTTTSLCDPDAADRIRHGFLNNRDREVTAVFLATDGVEDAYQDTWEDLYGDHVRLGGTKGFLRHLLLMQESLEETDRTPETEKFLQEFSRDGLYSKAGSEDDVSIAWIQNRPLPEKLRELFEIENRIYELEEESSKTESFLNGRQRKREYLKNEADRLQSKETELEDKIRKFKETREGRVKKEQELRKQKETEQRKLEQNLREAASLKVCLEPVLHSGIPKDSSLIKDAVSDLMEAVGRILETGRTNVFDLDKALNSLKENGKTAAEKESEVIQEMDVNRRQLEKLLAERQKMEDICTQAEAALRGFQNEIRELRRKRKVKQTCQVIKQVLFPNVEANFRQPDAKAEQKKTKENRSRAAEEKDQDEKPVQVFKEDESGLMENRKKNRKEDRFPIADSGQTDDSELLPKIGA